MPRNKALTGCAQAQIGKKGPQASLFQAPGRHWNGCNVNSLQLLVPVALLGWPEGRGGHPCHPGGLPPTTWWEQHGPRGPGAARAAAPCPPNWCCTAPMQRAANATRKIHNGLFCHLGGLPQPVLEFFLIFFTMRTRTQGVRPDRWPVLLQGPWRPIHIAPQTCRFGVLGGMGLRPGPHACLLPPWWLALGHHTAPGGLTRHGWWLAGPCPPCLANRPPGAHWQNHWGHATEPTMVRAIRACPSGLVCMLHATTRHGPGGIQTLGAWFWHTQAQGQLAALVPHSCVVLGSRFGNNGQPAGARKNSRRLVPPGWLTLAHQGWPMHPCCPLPCPLRQPPKPQLAQAAAQPALAPAVTGTGTAAHGPPPRRNAAPR